MSVARRGANLQLIHVDFLDHLETDPGEHRRHVVVNYLYFDEIDALDFGQLHGDLSAESRQSAIAITFTDSLKLKFENVTDNYKKKRKINDLQ